MTRIAAVAADHRLADFRNWLCLGFRHLFNADPTPVQYQMADWMQHGPRHQVTKGFRGIGKSVIVGFYATHQWALNKEAKILTVSASRDHAADLSTFIRTLLEEWPILAELCPDRDAIRDSRLKFDVAGVRPAKAASMTALGIGGQLAGQRADLILPDDVETIANSDTPGKREKIAQYVKEFGSILKPGGRIVYLGTDATEESLYRKLPERGYAVRCWPSRYPDADLRSALGDTLAPELEADLAEGRAEPGDPTDPTRFPDQVLREKEAEGRSYFRLQFQMDPRMSDMERYPLRLSDLVVMPLDSEVCPERVVYGGDQLDLQCVGFSGDRYRGPRVVAPKWVPYQGKVLAIDPAGRGKDETAACVVGQVNGYLALLHLKAWRGAGYSDEVLQELARIAAKFKVCQVVVEANFGDGMFSRLLEPHLARSGWHAAIEEVRVTGQKERRIIDTLEPVMEQHRLLVDPSVLEADLRDIPGVAVAAQAQYRLAYQLSRLTVERGALAHDDRVDAVSLGVQFWKDATAQVVERRQEEQRQREIDQELARAYRVATKPMFSHPGPPQGWLERTTGRPAQTAYRPPRGARGRSGPPPPPPAGDD